MFLAPLLPILALILATAPGAPGGKQHAPPSGPQVGSIAATFLPRHLTGPHAGRAACPLCVHGQQPGAAIWARAGGLHEAARLAQSLERALRALAPLHAVGYVVYLPDPTTSPPEADLQMRAAFEGVALEHVFLTVARPVENAAEIAAYEISPDATVRTTVVVYVNRVVHDVFLNLDGNPEALLRSALAACLAEEEPYPESAVALCGEDEPGEHIEFYGQVLDMDGRPLSRAAVVAYNTDAMGLYAPVEADTRVPRLRGVAVTDERGWFRFRTVYPGGYPGRDDPAHIHLTIAAPMHAIEYVTFWFEGDPRLTPTKRRSLDGETVIVRLQEAREGPRSFRHDVRLSGN